MRSLALLALVVACGPAPSPQAPSNRAPAPRGDRDQRAIETLRALSQALRHDQPLAALIDPRDGAWIWNQPGAMVSPSIHLAPGDVRRPSEIIAASGWPSGAQEGWATGLADAIDRGLGVLDLDGDPRAARYDVDCGDERMPPPPRALLRTRDIDLAAEQSGLADSPAAGVATPLGFSFRSGTAMVYLSERDGALAVAHLMLWYPCDA